jgi:DNA-binding LytR/AlgR family response regulator
MRIILCDDDIPFTQSFAKRLSSAFKDLGIKPEIIVTNTGIDALRQFTQKPTDALFLDIDMPDQDGFSVANELMKMRTKPLIIFLSSLEHLVYQSFAFQPFWFLHTCINCVDVQLTLCKGTIFYGTCKTPLIFLF